MYTIICFYKFCEISSTVLCKKKQNFSLFSLVIISACLHTLIVVPTDPTNLKTNKINWIQFSIFPPRIFLKFQCTNLSLPVGPMANIINRCLVKSAAMILSCFSRLNLQH